MTYYRPSPDGHIPPLRKKHIRGGHKIIIIADPDDPQVRRLLELLTQDEPTPPLSS